MRRSLRRFLAFALVLLCVAPAASAENPRGVPTVSAPALGVLGMSVQNDTSPPMRDIEPVPPDHPGVQVLPALPLPKPVKRFPKEAGPAGDQEQQIAQGVQTPQTLQSFDGLSNGAGVLPPDTVGDVGPNHYVQAVNISFAVYSKAGALLYGPAAGNTLYAGFGGACETTNNGDPIVLYDHLANRWLISQFAFPNGSSTGPFYQCIAISTSPDPLDPYHRYAFQMSSSKLNDYPKFGVWPNGYFMSANQFTASSWAGALAVVFERDKMLNGQAARMIAYDLFSVNPGYGGLLPADIDGPTPPSGAPNTFAMFAESPDRLLLWDFSVTWSTTPTSSFGNSGNPNTSVGVSSFDSDLCGYSPNCVPQQGTSARVDALSDRLMFRLAYRNLGSHQALVVNHTVDATGTDRAAPRWYELRRTTGAWSVYQQSTYSPDATHRFMGSVAMNAAGDIALGYSASSSSLYPSVRYTGRLDGDPLGTMTQTESTLVAGGGYQTHGSGRWGDYSSMSVDPVDDCTFWYTQEYYSSASSAGWRTRIGSFRLRPCTPAAEISGTVTNVSTGQPVSGATVAAAGPTTASTTTDSAGRYRLFGLAGGTYTVTANGCGFAQSSSNGIVATEGAVTTHDISLSVASPATISGTVSDATGGWPLYAKVVLAGCAATTVFTNPETGAFSTTVAAGPYTVTTTSMAGTYTPIVRSVSLPAGSSTLDPAAMTADASACDAPGYQRGGLTESFATTTKPAAWTVVDHAGTGQVWRFDDPGRRGNVTGGSGSFAVVDSDDYGIFGVQDTSLVSPAFDLSLATGAVLEFDNDLRMASTSGSGAVADVDVSTDDGSTWTNVWRRTLSARTTREIVEVSDIAAGRSNVRVRFRYSEGQYDYWWEIDNIVVGPGSCTRTANAVIVGQLRTDRVAQPGTVSDDLGNATTAFATLADPAIDEGLYVLGTTAGGRTLSGSVGGCPVTAQVTAVTGAATTADLNAVTAYQGRAASTAPHPDALGFGAASATASADHCQGALYAAAWAMENAPAGMKSGATRAGLSEAYANARMVHAIPVSAGTRTVVVTFTLDPSSSASTSALLPKPAPQPASDVTAKLTALFRPCRGCATANSPVQRSQIIRCAGNTTCQQAGSTFTLTISLVAQAAGVIEVDTGFFAYALAQSVGTTVAQATGTVASIVIT